MASKSKATAPLTFDLSQVKNRIVGHVELLPSEIQDHPLQAWDHPESQAKALVGILGDVGIIDELLVYRSPRAGGAWVTPDGHLRKSLDPHKPWPCTIVDLTDAEADYVLATKDTVAMMKRANAEALDALFSVVETNNKAVQDMLTNAAQAAGMYLEQVAQESAAAQTDHADELQAAWEVQPGQVWGLLDGQGREHRIVCGDCRDAASWDALLEGTQANGICTSPPYAEQRKEQYGGVPVDQYVSWWEGVQAQARAHLAADGSFFVNIKPHCEAGERVLYVFDLVLAMRRQWGWKFVDELCWRNVGVPGSWPNRFKDGFEPVYHFALGACKFRPQQVAHFSQATFSGPGGMAGRGSGKGWLPRSGPTRAGLALPDNVIETGHGDGGHAAAFPVALPAFFVQAYSDPGDTWLDPFAGSGSTLLAAAQQGRVGLGIEVLPKYVAVTLQRWQDTFGTVPELLSDG